MLTTTLNKIREHETPEKECLQLIADIAVGYDGFGTVENLKGLIDEMKAYAFMGLKGKWPTEPPPESEYEKAIRTGVKPAIWPPIVMTREELNHFRATHGMA